MYDIWSTNIYFLHMFTRLGGGQDSPHPPLPHRHRVPTPMWVFLELSWLCLKQWRIQKFQNQGRGSGTVEFLVSWDCFDALSHIPNVFVVRVVNKIHIVNICMLYSQNFGKAILRLLERCYNAFLISKKAYT